MLESRCEVREVDDDVSESESEVSAGSKVEV